MVFKPVSIEAIVATTQKELTANVRSTDATSTLYDVPVQLSIPKIGIETNVLPMGLTDDNDMEAPPTNDDAGWYRYGTRPGNEGSAVIAGHFGLRGDAVFGKLGSLEKGDVIFVNDVRGQQSEFIVIETRQYAYDANPREVFTSTSGTHLNLITCNGDWDTSQNSYANRLVVFTQKV